MSPKDNIIPYKISLHGGHSGQFCDHAKGNLRDLVEAAIKQGMPVFGLSEHCPRYNTKDLFPQEIKAGWNVEHLIKLFNGYSKEASLLQNEYADRIELVRGFEVDVVDSSYYPKMLELKSKGSFDYIVGSVHHVRGRCFDGVPELFNKIVEDCGGPESFAVEYYRDVQKMVEALKPEVVGHLDLVTKFEDNYQVFETIKIKEQVQSTLETIKKAGSILDLNVYPLRRNKPYPYPAPWIVEMAHKMGIEFCFGDDSHSPETVGVGIEQGREYLLSFGLKTITALRSRRGSAEKFKVNL